MSIDRNGDDESGSDSDASRDSAYYVLYDVPFRCGLCRFQFRVGETFVADIRGHRSIPQKMLHGVKCALLEYDGEGELPTVLDRACIQPCRDNDDVPPGTRKRTVGYHPGCLDMWGCGDGLPPTSLHKATAYAFTPTHGGGTSYEAARRDRILSFLHRAIPRLFSDCRVRLPAELWSAIVNLVVDDGDDGDDDDTNGRDDCIVRLYAIETIRQLWEQRHTDTQETQELEIEVDLETASCIWASYICIDGVQYVQRLTSTPPDGNESECWRNVTNALSLKTKLYILQDHLGVRRILFFTEDGDLVKKRMAECYKTKTTTETWWRRVQLGPGQQLRVISDGLKVRSIKVVFKDKDEYPGGLEDMVWPIGTLVPKENLNTLQYCPSVFPDKDRGSWYMASMDCNAPDITGYSALWTRNNLAVLHAHRDGEDLSFYGHYDELYPATDTSVWIYFPVLPGERLVDVFCRRHEDGDCYMGLLVRTSRGRHMILGPGLQVPGSMNEDGSWRGLRPGSFLWYRHVCRLPADRPSRIHFNTAPFGIRQLAFERDPTEEAEKTETGARQVEATLLPLHLSTTNMNGQYCAWFASLDGLATVAPSYKTNPHYKDSLFICGLLFSYSDGRPCAPFGEFRLDNVGQPLHVSSPPSAHLHFGYSYHGDWVPSHLTHVALDTAQPFRRTTIETANDGREIRISWQAVPLWGSAEMWTDGFRSFVHHTTRLDSRRDSDSGYRSFQKVISMNWKGNQD